MLSAFSPKVRRRPWALASILTLVITMEAAASDPLTNAAIESAAKERSELFVALLRRRAQRILEERREPLPQRVSLAAGLAYGYESNVALDGERRGDFFAEETLSLAAKPLLSSRVTGEITYDLLNLHYTDLTDNHLWMNTIGTTLQWSPHARLRLDAAHELGMIEFPQDRDNSFLDHRTSLAVLLAYAKWLTHKVNWTYQSRPYDSRATLDSEANPIVGSTRQDQRHTLTHELHVRLPNTFVRLGLDWYRNFSNESFQSFYDWDDYRTSGVISRALSPQWIAILAATHERRNYHERNVSAIGVKERDDLVTLATSVIWQLSKSLAFTYSLTYRHQDSNDPRLDFTDLINRVGMTANF